MKITSRKKCLFFCLLLLSLSIHAYSQSAKDAAEVRALEDKRIEAMLKRDVKTLEELFTPGVTYGHGNGLVETGMHFLDRLRESGDLIYTTLDRDEVRVRVFKNTALITGTVAIKVRLNGQDRNPGRASFLAVWVKEKGKWKFAAWQSARIE